MSSAVIDAIVREIVIKAPAKRVFAAIADPQQRVQWWGAEGKFKAASMESDLRVGGAWIMRGSGMGGAPFTIRGEYLAVDPPRLLETTWQADWETDAPKTVVRWELIESNGSTTVRITHSGFAGEKAKENYQGWPWLLAMLRDYAEKNK